MYSTDTRSAKHRLKKQQQTDASSAAAARESIVVLAGSGPGSVKLMQHVDELVQKNKTLHIEMNVLRKWCRDLVVSAKT